MGEGVGRGGGSVQGVWEGVGRGGGSVQGVREGGKGWGKVWWRRIIPCLGCFVFDSSIPAIQPIIPNIKN